MDGVLIVSHARIYYAPAGTERLAPNFPVGHAWPTPWVDVGFTASPTVFTYDPGEVTAWVEQHLGPVNRFKARIGSTLKTTLAETSVLNMQLAWDGCETDVQSGLETLTLGDYRWLQEMAWGIEGEALDERYGLVPVRLFIPRGTAVVGGSELWAKAGLHGTPLTIAALLTREGTSVALDPFEVKGVYAALNRGVYTTPSWTFGDATDPVWQDITYNLPADLGLVGLRHFVCDPFDVSHAQFIVAEDAPTRSVWRRLDGASEWEQVLTAAEMQAGLGWPSFQIWHVGVNWWKRGTFYVSGETNITEGGNGVAITGDYGDTWSFVRTAESIYGYGVGNIHGMDKYVYLGQNIGMGGDARIWLSGSWGADWYGYSPHLGQSAWQPAFWPTPDFKPLQGWVSHFESPDRWYAEYYDAIAGTVYRPAAAADMHDDLYSCAGGYASAPLKRRKVAQVNDLYLTEDAWETLTHKSLPFHDGILLAPLSVGQMAFGGLAAPNVWATADDGDTCYQKAGANWNRPDLGYTGSIPENKGAIAWNGIWFYVARMQWWP